MIKLCPVEWRPAGAAIIITLMMDMQRYNNILETRSASPRDFRKKSTATCNTYLLSQRNVALRVALIGKSEIISRIIAIAKCLRRVMSEIRRERERERVMKIVVPDKLYLVCGCDPITRSCNGAGDDDGDHDLKMYISRRLLYRISSLSVR